MINIKQKIKQIFRQWLNKMPTAADHSIENISVLNDNFNRVLMLSPRVTSSHEHVTLFNISAISKGDVIEVGCYLCYSSVMIASGFGDANRKLYAIDLFDREKGWSNGGTDDWIFKNYSQKEFAEKIIADCGLDNKVVLKKARSDQIIFDDNELNNVGMIFIDGDHTYNGCENDLNKYSPLLNEGGFIIMHDYINKNCQVKAATDDFLKDNKHFKSLFLVDSMLVVKKM